MKIQIKNMPHDFETRYYWIVANEYNGVNWFYDAWKNEDAIDKVIQQVQECPNGFIIEAWQVEGI